MSNEKKPASTVNEFGVQWTKYTENTGFYASTGIFDSLFGTLLRKEDLAGKKIADIGAGAGRYTKLFSQLGAASILALEPSEGFATLEKNTADLKNVTRLRATADKLPGQDFDWVFCIGVLQFIPDAQTALRSMGQALCSQGRIFVWVYGRENVGIYLIFLKPLRFIAKHLSHRVLGIMAAALVYPATLYGLLCRAFPLPLSEYLCGYFMKLDRYSRKVVIYDQLNPGYSRYYSKAQLKELFENSGFTDLQFYNRLNTSWSVTARYGEQEST